jgi:hypothetical protein
MFIWKKIILKTTQRRWTIVAMLGIATLGLIIFVAWPAAKATMAASKTIQTLARELQNKRQDYSLPTILATYKQYEPKITTLQKSVLYRDRELEFVTTLESIADRYNLDQQITLGEPQPIKGKKFNSLNLQIVATGDFNNALRYLEALEHSPLYLNIQRLGMSSVEGGRVSLHLAVETFWR